MNSPIAIHAFHSGVLWASQGHRILHQESPDTGFTPYAGIPTSFPGDLLPPLNRLLRRGVHHILPLSSRRIVVVAKGQLLFMEDRNITHAHTIARGSRPLRSGICVLPGETVIYGDYWGNPDRQPVEMHISQDGGKHWDTLWRSNAGEARHIHLIQPVLGCPEKIYFSTGDRDHEANLFTLDLSTGSVEKIGGGSQDWRMVSLLQTEGAIIWGSDCEYGQNHIYRFDLKTGQLEQLHDIPAPAYYSTRDSRGRFYIATTVEDRRRHQAAIFTSDNGLRWSVFRTFKKDLWPAKLFGYGMVEFIDGQEKIDSLLYNLKGLL